MTEETVQQTNQPIIECTRCKNLRVTNEEILTLSELLFRGQKKFSNIVYMLNISGKCEGEGDKDITDHITYIDRDFLKRSNQITKEYFDKKESIKALNKNISVVNNNIEGHKTKIKELIEILEKDEKYFSDLQSNLQKSIKDEESILEKFKDISKTAHPELFT